MDINAEMKRLMDEEIAYYDEMEAEYESRMNDLRDMRNSVQEMRNEVDEEAGEDADMDPDLVMEEIVDFQNNFMEQFPPEMLENPTGNLPGFDKMFDLLTTAQDRGERAINVIWRRRLTRALDMYLDALDTSIAQVEADQAVLGASRLRTETLRAFAGI